MTQFHMWVWDGGRGRVNHVFNLGGDDKFVVDLVLRIIAQLAGVRYGNKKITPCTSPYIVEWCDNNVRHAGAE